MILANLAMQDYVRDQIPGVPVATLSASIAHRLLTRSALHARWAHPRLSPAWEPKHRRDFDLGTAAHAMLIEGTSSGLVVIDAPSYKTKAAQDARDAAYAEWKTPVLSADIGRLEAMVGVAQDAINLCPDLAGVPLSTLRAERTIVWREGDAWCRCRPDWMTPDRAVVLSYKTTGNAEPDAFARVILGNGYDVQGAFECAAIRAESGETPRYVWVAQETEPPYAVSLIGLSPDLADLAASKFRVAVERWAHCLATGTWPAYPDRICYLDPPAWARAAWMERENAHDNELHPVEGP